MRSVHSVGVVVAVAGLAWTAGAGVISDVSHFSSIPTTLVDFETNGGGSPVILAEGGTLLMPAGEYGALGITFSPQVHWVNDGSSDFDSAQAIGGSLDNAIPSSAVNVFTLSFSTPVRSFGLWVVNNHNVDAAGPIFEARDASNQLIESVQFNGGLIDGTVGVASYGFMGVWSATPIASVTITKQAAIFDDLRISPDVPAPACGAVLGAAGLWSLRRRRMIR